MIRFKKGAGAGAVTSAVILIFGLSGCTEFPSLDERITTQAAAAPFPTLQPLAPLLAQVSVPPQITTINVQTSDSRIAALNAKAARLRGTPVVDPDTRRRMNAGIDTSDL